MSPRPVFDSAAMFAKDMVIGVTSHDQAILEANLKRSPAITSTDLQLLVETGSPSASIAYNRILDRSDAPVVVFAHHDVYLPTGWDTLLRARIKELEDRDPDWAVLAPFGIGHDRMGYGPVWSSSLGEIVGRVALEPVPVQAVDELVIIVRRGSGLRFDETLPGFHLYGTDIVQSALSRGLGAYVMSLPVVHNDGFKGDLDASFAAAYRHQSRKWRAQLPIFTPITRISWHMLSLHRSRHRAARSLDYRRSMAVPVTEDPRRYAQSCGWNDLSPDHNAALSGLTGAQSTEVSKVR